MKRNRIEWQFWTDEEFESVEKCYPLGEVVDLEPEICECGSWIVGERRCECGNVRVAIEFESGIPYVEAS